MCPSTIDKPKFMAGTEILPGYVLREKIGEGGFGEVWSADAPGGLLKAIKFVYGDLGGVRAIQEMEALEKIKSLRHPFLLSTERIEVINQSLVMVLELADGNLMERFEACQEEGLTGIPRDELLQHFSDAADALDYLWEKQSLQHLDIKPENLMLSGGRTKIGDFGLLRQIGEDEGTLLGGVTPAYAPPEVFGGRPTGQSDQYSFAVSFQELLTGQLPFRGRTAAQLAMQHVHHPPNLDPLPVAVRPVIRRALAKNPEHRFPNCRAFVKELGEAFASRSSYPTPSSAKISSGIRRLLTDQAVELPARQISSTATSLGMASLPQTGTQVMQEDDTRNDVTQISSSGTEASPSSLPPIAVSGEEEVRPTFFVGIGGIGIRTLEIIRQSLTHSFDEDFTHHHFGFLGIETDESFLRRSSSGQVSGDPSDSCLESQHLLHTPLRPAQAYLEDFRAKFSSMSKRWVCNVPRSLTTQRCRPLGRLALVDHVETIRERCEQRLPSAFFAEGSSAVPNQEPAKTDAREAAATSRTNSGVDRHPAKSSSLPLVVLVGSISGGTASGMMNELAYLVRDELKRANVKRAEVIGFASLSPPADDSSGDLRAANALAFLNELEFLRQDEAGYPGDNGADIPACELPGGPYDWLYFFGRPDEVQELESNVANLGAEFILLNVMAKSQELFNASRHCDPSKRGDATRFRSFGLGKTGIEGVISTDLQVHVLCRELLQRWMGSRSLKQPLCSAHHSEITRWTSRSLGRLSQPAEELAKWIQERTLEKLELTQAGLIGKCAKNAITSVLSLDSAGDGKALFNKMLGEIDAAFRANVSATTPASSLSFVDVITTVCQPLIADLAETTREWFSSLVDTMMIRLPGAEIAVEQALRRLRKGMEEAEALQASLRNRTEACRDSIFTELVLFAAQTEEPHPTEKTSTEEEQEEAGEEDGEPLTQLARHLEEYTRLRLRDLMLKVTTRVFESALRSVEPGVEWLQAVREKLIHLSRRYPQLSRRPSARPEAEVNQEQAGIRLHNLIESANSIDESEKGESQEEDETLQRLFEGRFDELLTRLDEQTSTFLAGAGRTLSNIPDAEGAELELVTQRMEEFAQRLIDECPGSTADSKGVGDQAGDSAIQGSLQTTIGEAISASQVEKAMQGAAERIVVLAPANQREAQIAKRVQELTNCEPTVRAVKSLDAAFVRESIGVSPGAIARWLCDGDEQRIKLAERLATRTDIYP